MHKKLEQLRQIEATGQVQQGLIAVNWMGLINELWVVGQYQHWSVFVPVFSVLVSNKVLVKTCEKLSFLLRFKPFVYLEQRLVGFLCPIKKLIVLTDEHFIISFKTLEQLTKFVFELTV